MGNKQAVNSRCWVWLISLATECKDCFVKLVNNLPCDITQECIVLEYIPVDNQVCICDRCLRKAFIKHTLANAWCHLRQANKHLKETYVSRILGSPFVMETFVKQATQSGEKIVTEIMSTVTQVSVFCNMPACEVILLLLQWTPHIL